MISSNLNISSSDIIAIVAVLISVASAYYTRKSSIATVISHSIGFRGKWQEAYETVSSAMFAVSPPTGSFATLIKRRPKYLYGLDHEIIEKLLHSCFEESLLVGGGVASEIERALDANKQIEIHWDWVYNSDQCTMPTEETFQIAEVTREEIYKHLASAQSVLLDRLQSTSPVIAKI